MSVFIPKQVKVELFKTIFFYIVWCRFCLALLTNNIEIDLDYVSNQWQEDVLRNITKDPYKNAKESRFKTEYRKKINPYRDPKYILLWTTKSITYEPWSIIGEGQKGFKKFNCSVINCYITADKNFFGGDLTKFDVISFLGQFTDPMKRKDLPPVRTPRQKYMYDNLESSGRYPIRNRLYENYFNWTFTFKLDSDIVCTYFLVRNKRGELVGPREDMKWDELDNELPSWAQNDNDVDIANFDTKTKAAAWFVSNCLTDSGREFLVDVLNRTLKRYNLTIDVYGYCGDLHCPKKLNTQCHEMLKKEYFFYMALENSFAVDYVTEKVVTGLNNDVIPIVWGGANYSRFLPPNSYLDARKMTTGDLAEKMYQLMNNKQLYLQYFKWKKYYSFELAPYNFCGLCDIVNDDFKFNTFSSYSNIAKWWNNDQR